MSRTSNRAVSILASLVLLVSVSAGHAQSETSPWNLLQNLRDAMQKAGPMASRFTQTYTPAGFTEGDRERGHFSMWLPDCLRWNYEEPQDKNFLVCEGEVYYWSLDEPGGRHYKIDPREEPGMDLLLVPVDQLRERYNASSKQQSDGTWVISLNTPGEDTFSARIRLDASRERVAVLEYTDDEGNLTSFEIYDYQRLTHTALFQPPGDIEWSEE